MGRSVVHYAFLRGLAARLFRGWGAAQDAAVRDAAVAMGRGDFRAAEKTRRAAVGALRTMHGR
jgi:hypothetical protein